MEATIIDVTTETTAADAESTIKQEALLRELTSLELGLVGGGAVAVSFL